jgi:hypothetical protein
LDAEIFTAAHALPPISLPQNHLFDRFNLDSPAAASVNSGYTSDSESRLGSDVNHSSVTSRCPGSFCQWTPHRVSMLEWVNWDGIQPISLYYWNRDWGKEIAHIGRIQ